ncbi:gamma-glutamylcyclotransferase family protein [Egbenema bharatensis]|uniref:gamma-glutamylcyclotransferase family protein n=1 Tax=Egbenema bharatensis TaxID=3463334 RepID=UPI003A871302
MTSPFHVFTYGTLKPGEHYFDRYCAKWVIEIQEAIAYGELYDLPLGYPAMTWGDRIIYGTRLSFTEPAVLTALDELEDYSPDRPPQANEYLRVQRPIFDLNTQPLGLAWVYWMAPQKAIELGGVLLPDGQWAGSKTNTLPIAEF